MKFAVAGILVALAVCASSSVVPLSWYSVAHHAPLAHHWAAPITQYSSIDLHHGHYDHGHYAHGHDDGSWDEARYGDHYNHWDNHAHHAVVHAPIVHAPIVHAHVAHGATYTAKTRGALHTAPLAGHAVSQTSLNLAPAPGTL